MQFCMLTANGPPGAERIPGLVWRGVAGAGDVAAALAQGSAARVTGATAMNVASSRSHALLAVRLAPAQPGGAAATLHLVDLAGVILPVPVKACQSLE